MQPPLLELTPVKLAGYLFTATQMLKSKIPVQLK